MHALSQRRNSVGPFGTARISQLSLSLGEWRVIMHKCISRPNQSFIVPPVMLTTTERTTLDGSNHQDRGCADTTGDGLAIFISCTSRALSGSWLVINRSELGNLPTSEDNVSFRHFSYASCRLSRCHPAQSPQSHWSWKFLAVSHLKTCYSRLSWNTSSKV